MSITCEKQNYRIPRKRKATNSNTANYQSLTVTMQAQQSIIPSDNLKISAPTPNEGEAQKPGDLPKSKEKTQTKTPAKNGLIKRSNIKIEPKSQKSNSPATPKIVQKNSNPTTSNISPRAIPTKKNGISQSSGSAKKKADIEATKKNKPDKLQNAINGGGRHLLDDIFEQINNTQKSRENAADSKSPDGEAATADKNVAGPSSNFQQPPTPVPTSFRPLTRVELNRCDQDNNGMIQVFLQKDGLMERILGFKMLRGRVEPYPAMRIKVDLDTCVSPVYEKPADGEILLKSSPPAAEPNTPPLFSQVKISESALRSEHPLNSLNLVEPVPIINTPVKNRGPKTPPGSPGIRNSSRSSATGSNHSHSEAVDASRENAEDGGGLDFEQLPPPPALPDLIGQVDAKDEEMDEGLARSYSEQELQQMDPGVKSIGQQPSHTNRGSMSILDGCAMEISSESSEASKEERKDGREDAAFPLEFEALLPPPPPPPPAGDLSAASLLRPPPTPPETTKSRPVDCIDPMLVPPPPLPPNIRAAVIEPVRMQPMPSYYLTTAPPPGSSMTSPVRMPPMPILPIPCLFQQPPPNLSVPPPPIPTMMRNPNFGPGPSTSSFKPPNNRPKAFRQVRFPGSTDENNARKTMASRYYPPPRTMPLNAKCPPPKRQRHQNQPTVNLDFIKHTPPPPIPEILKKPVQARPQTFQRPLLINARSDYRNNPMTYQPPTANVPVNGVGIPGQDNVFQNLLQVLSPQKTSKSTSSFLRPPNNF